MTPAQHPAQPRAPHGPPCLAAPLAALLALILNLAAPVPATAAPERVVSINLCTDQLAMMLAAPGQLVAVSSVARDPRVSPMAEEAAQYRVTHGGAEDVFRLAPDLVLAGTYTTPHTVSMLRRLGVEVVAFEPGNTLASIHADILRMGAALGREEAAEALADGFARDLAALRDASAANAARPRAALFQANSWTSGPQTLAGEILTAAGLANVAAEAGLQWGGTLPLERLIMLAPDIVITAQRYPGASRSEEVLAHPALLRFREGRTTGAVSDADWVCGTPHVLSAIARLHALHFGPD